MMKKIIFISLLFFLSFSLFAYPVKFAEDYYKLYAERMGQGNNNELQNLYYLEKALRSDFANPLYALAQVHNKTQWTYYTCLFRMHVFLLIIQTNLELAKRFDKQEVDFYNVPFRPAIMKSFEQAQNLYEYTRTIWPLAKYWAKEADKKQFRGIELPEITYWQDEEYEIIHKKLNYEAIIEQQLGFLLKKEKKLELLKY